MYDYRQLASMIVPIDETSLILYDIGNEEKEHVVKQYNRALINARADGSDMAQVYLKPIISKYTNWGDPAVLFGICLAIDGEYRRAEQSFEYAIKNVISSENNLAIAQEALRRVREDAKNPMPKTSQKTDASKSAMVSNDDSVSSRKGMQAPILVRASRGGSKTQIATDKERREVLLRAQSTNGELASDNISIAPVITPADRMKIAMKVVLVLLGVVALALIVVFVVLPAIEKLSLASDNEERLDYLVERMGENADDPEVAAIIADYADEFDTESNEDEASQETTTTVAETVASTETSAETQPAETSVSDTVAETTVETTVETTAETSAA